MTKLKEPKEKHLEMNKTRVEPDISSSTNSKFKTWKSLLSSQGIRKSGLFILSGEKILRELQSVDLKIESWLVRASQAENPQSSLPPTLDRKSRFVLTNELFDELNELNVPGALAIVKRPELKDADLSLAPKGLEIILALQDPSNLGASLRVAEAFNATKVILLKECCEPFLPKASRTASSSNFRLNLQRGPSIKDLSGSLTGPVVVLDMHGQNIAKIEWPKNVRLFLGVEGPGVPEEFRRSKDFIQARIEMNKAVDSLNAVSALSIACFSYQSK